MRRPPIVAGSARNRSRAATVIEVALGADRVALDLTHTCVGTPEKLLRDGDGDRDDDEGG